VRAALITIGTVSVLGVCWLLWARRQRQLYLRDTRTDEEVEERFLTDPAAVGIDFPGAIARRVSRVLRRRYASDRLAVEVPGTLRATMAACGGLSPRYSVVKQTPEYVLLVDRRHPSDHHAAYCEALATALMRHGVAMQVYYFEGSPQPGCWRLRGHG